MTDSTLISLKDTSVAQISGEMFCYFSETFVLRLAIARGFVLLHLTSNIPQRCSIRFKSDNILGLVIFFKLFSSLETFTWFWQCALDRNIPFLASFWRLGVISSASILSHPQAFMVPHIYIHAITFCIMLLRITLPPPCFTVRSKLW